VSRCPRNYAAKPSPYQFCTHIGSAATKQMRSFIDLAQKLKMPLGELILQCKGMETPSKALVKGLARELDIKESFLIKLADEVRRDLAAK
jgi:hypothetical protein